MSEIEFKEDLEALKREQRIKKKSEAIDALFKNKESFACQHCGTTTIKRDGKIIDIPNHNSRSQHEKWCKKNPNSRRKNGTIVETLENELNHLKLSNYSEYAKFQEVLNLTNALNLTKEQILKLIKFKMGEPNGT